MLDCTSLYSCTHTHKLCHHQPGASAAPSPCLVTLIDHCFDRPWLDDLSSLLMFIYLFSTLTPPYYHLTLCILCWITPNKLLDFQTTYCMSTNCCGLWSTQLSKLLFHLLRGQAAFVIHSKMHQQYKSLKPTKWRGRGRRTSPGTTSDASASSSPSSSADEMQSNRPGVSSSLRSTISSRARINKRNKKKRYRARRAMKRRCGYGKKRQLSLRSGQRRSGHSSPQSQSPQRHDSNSDDQNLIGQLGTQAQVSPNAPKITKTGRIHWQTHNFSWY